MKNFKFFIVLFLFFFQIIKSQNLLVSSKENIYDKELNSIKRGKINSYQSLRYLYEWNNNKTKNDLLISELGKEFLRNQRSEVWKNDKKAKKSIKRRIDFGWILGGFWEAKIV